MRLVSNKESVARGEVSILAIVETLLAIALVFYLSAHFNTLRWLAVAMCVSPLLLLRTEESTRLGIDWYNGFGQWLVKRLELKRRPTLRSVVGKLSLLISAVPLGILAAFVIRIRATVTGLGRTPLQSVQAIPRNWSRITLATDSAFPPELIPEHEKSTFESWLRQFRATGRLGKFIGLIVVVPLFVPSLLYRWSLKATSIIYAPLVFVAHSTFSEGSDLRTKLELIKRGDLSRIRVWYGVIAITAFAVKLVLMMNLPGFAGWWEGHPVSQFLALYVAPAEIPKWQLAELANSALAISSMLFARRALLGYELQHPWPEMPVKRLLGFVSGLRWVLALYAILCTGYITMRAAQHWHWPALGEQWLPW